MGLKLDEAKTKNMEERLHLPEEPKGPKVDGAQPNTAANLDSANHHWTRPKGRGAQCHGHPIQHPQATPE